MLAVGVGWQVYALTGSALDLALSDLLNSFPRFCSSWSRDTLPIDSTGAAWLQACVIVEALAAGGLALGSYQDGLPNAGSSR
jgi:hypothetical protein